MEEIKNNQSVFEEPKIEVVYLTVKDIITTSGDPQGEENPQEEIPQESELIPVALPPIEKF